MLLVVIIVPGLYASIYGSLTANQAAWGLLGVDVLQGDWISPDLGDQSRVPPLFAWCTAAMMAIPLADKLWLATMPSYFFGLASIALVYLIGRACCSPGVAVLTTFLFGLNQLLLRQIEAGEPSTCIVALALLSLYCFIRQLYRDDRVCTRWTIVGTPVFACLILSAGFFALWIPLIAVVFAVYFHLQTREQLRDALEATFASPTSAAGVLVVGGGILLASPWILWSDWNAGPYFPFSDPTTLLTRPEVAWGAIVSAMPATIVLGVFGVWRGAQDCLRGRALGELFPLLLFWSMLAWLALRLTSATEAALLFAIVPLTMLAVQTLFDIVERNLRDRQILALLLLSVCVFVVSRTTALRELHNWLASGDWSAQRKLDVHLAMDGLVLACIPVIGLYRLSAGFDRRRRALLGAYVMTVILLASVPGLMQFRGPRRRDDACAQLFHLLQQRSPYDRVVFVGKDAKSTDLAPIRFAVKAAERDAPVDHVADRAALVESLSGSDSADPLVLVTDPNQRLQRTAAIRQGNYVVTLHEIHSSEDVLVYARERVARAGPTP